MAGAMRTTIMGTDKDPHSFKNVMDHAIEDGKIKPLIIVLPTYNNTSEEIVEITVLQFSLPINFITSL